MDDAVIAPVARAYKRGLSDDVRDGIRNAINNIDEPIVFVNFLLQLKIGKAFETAGRFAINSTVGVAGIMDVAKKKPFNLPRRSNGLADTLGYYGVDGKGRDNFGQLADSRVLLTVTFAR